MHRSIVWTGSSRCIRLRGLAREDEAAEREESWGGAKSLWGLANTVEQLRTISRLQQEFCEWFYGHWLAEYAKAAKEVIGPVPVFVCSAAISGDADQYLAMHRWALREGVDGLSEIITAMAVRKSGRRWPALPDG